MPSACHVCMNIFQFHSFIPFISFIESIIIFFLFIICIYLIIIHGLLSARVYFFVILNVNVSKERVKLCYFISMKCFSFELSCNSKLAFAWTKYGEKKENQQNDKSVFFRWILQKFIATLILRNSPILLHIKVHSLNKLSMLWRIAFFFLNWSVFEILAYLFRQNKLF